jgi:hypothetical protein
MTFWTFWIIVLKGTFSTFLILHFKAHVAFPQVCTKVCTGRFKRTL